MSAELAEILSTAGYWGLLSSDAADRAWAASGEGEGLRALVLEEDGDATARLLAAELLARRDGSPGALPSDALARAYVDGLRAGAFAEMANPWGIPSGPLGPLGERVASLGAAAIEPLAGALGDRAPVRFGGSRDATIGNSYGWRVKDVAAWVLAEITGAAFKPDGDPVRRDAAIRALRRHVQALMAEGTP